MKSVGEMRQDQGGNTMSQSIDTVPPQPSALSMALKQRRLAKAQKRRLTETNAPDDNPSAISDSQPTEE